MVNILPMVKMYLFPFCKPSLCFDPEPPITLVRPHPFYPPNWSLNYHEYQANWTLTIKKLPVGRLFDKFISPFGLIFATKEFVDYSLPREIVPGGHLIQSCAGKTFLPSSTAPRGKRPSTNPCFVHGEREPSFRGNLTFSGSLGNF